MKKNVVIIFVVFVLFGLLIGAKDWKAPSQRNGETETSFAVQPWFGQPEDALRTRAEQTGETAEMLQFTSGSHVLGFKPGEAVIAAGNYALKIEFINSRPVAPVERGLWDSSFGSKSKPLSEVIYNGLWENVDLVYERHDSGVVKSTYFIQPGEDGVSKAVESIRLGYNVPVRIKENGTLLMSFDEGWMEETPPVAWQEIDGQRHPVEVTYKKRGEKEIGFNVGAHNDQYPLVIDPVLSWDTLSLETHLFGRTYCIAVDTSGNVYVSGYNSGYLFVAKLDTNGGVTWNTSMGSGVLDGGYNIVVDASGNVYVVGFGAATWGTPINAYTGGEEVFAAKLNSSGVLQWHTFMGSAPVDPGDGTPVGGVDIGTGIAVDTSGNVYVTGYSDTTWGATPLNAHVGGEEIFVTKLSSAGAYVWHTFLGSASGDRAFGLALDTSGDVYVTGRSAATWGTPVNSHAGSWDIFAAKVNASGALQWNTFLGSGNNDYSFGIALDATGNVHLAGRSSTTWGTPVNAFSGNLDAFAAKLNTSGALVWNTFMGSATGDDRGFGLALDTGGNVYVAGHSDVTWGSPKNAYNASNDAFAAKLDTSGVLLWNTFIGTEFGDLGYGAGVDTLGNVFISGFSGSEALVAKIDPKDLTVTAPNGAEIWLVGTVQNITWTTLGTVGPVKIEYSTDNGVTWSDVIASTANTGTYPWTIPDFPSAQCYVRVSEVADPLLFDMNDAVFTIWPLPNLVVNSPNGAETWEVGSVQNIVWTPIGTVGPVKIEYSIDSGAAWTDIIASTANTGTYPWTIPNTPSDLCMVRISEAADGIPVDTSDLFFSIVPESSVTLTSPNGGESWEVASAQNITWTTLGIVGAIKIEYSADSGVAWTEIVASTANTGTYPWTIPNTTSALCLVRISEAADGSTVDTSDAIFSIVPVPGLTLTSPNGGESWVGGSAQNITWTSVGTVGPVKIEYSINNGAAWTDIIASTANTGTYPWTVSNTPATVCLVRISEAADSIPVDTSDAVFTILAQPELTLTSPNGGESWEGGSAHNITWTTAGTVGPVKIEYSTDNGVAWTDIIASTANTGTYPWSVPNTPSTESLVRISEAADSIPVDTSDAVFTIAALPEISLTSPNGGESWEVASVQNITWTTVGTVGDVKIEYSTDNGVAWTEIVNPSSNDGTHPWTIPDTSSAQCLLRISEAADGSPIDSSDAVFSIVPAPGISITSPNGGESWDGGSAQNITWTSEGTVGDVKIEYSTDSGTSWTEVVASTPNDGTHPWTIPNTPSAQCLVRIGEAADGSPSDTSDAVFSILFQPQITVTSPNGGESWEVGSAHNITWTSEGTVGDVKIEYSTDNGTSWTEIVNPTANDGTHPWTAPNTPSDQCLVRISEAADGSPVDSSDTIFSIVPIPAISVTSPNGGENWVVGSAHNITWTSEGTVGDVKIEYSTDNGTAWTEIVNPTANDGTHPWTVPSTMSVMCLVRISEAADGNPVDTSDAVFSITAISLTSPNGGESWETGSSQNITWTTAGVVGDVKIEYSTDNGTAWTVIVNPTANDGIHPWTVPNTPSAQCLVRVSEASDGSPMDTSDAVFTIKVTVPPAIILNPTSLNFGAVLAGGSTSAQQTSDQNFRITNTGGGLLNWSITDNADWITCSNITTAEFSATQLTGIGNAVIEVSVDPTGYSAGTLNGTITVSDPSSSNLSQTVEVELTIKKANDSDPPFGSFDTPLGGSVVSGSMAVTGWALDDIEVKHVEIKRSSDPDDNPATIGSDGLVHIGYAFLVKGSRTDVEALYPDYPLNDRAGWGYMMLTFGLPRRGNGNFTLYAFAEDVEGKSTLLGTKDIVADNANRVKPFGTIDTPGPGQIISGSAYVNFGWALTPPASTNKYIAYDGSTVYWSIDSVVIGNVDYGDYRADIAGAFPECLNANTAGGHKYIDTTMYANGVHTIGWYAVDNEGFADGFGSRFFEIQNSGATSLEMAGMENTQYEEDFSGRLRIDIDGPKEIEIEELGQIKLELRAEGGTKIIGWGADITKNLPIGSTLVEEDGIFYWMPGIGFLNQHVLHFAVTDGSSISQPVEVIINIVPKRYEIRKNRIK